MRRFIKTFTVKKHTQFLVVQDGALRVFQVERLDAASQDRATVPIGEAFPYENHRDSIDGARGRAIGFARRLAAEAEQSLALAGGAAQVPSSPADEASLDAAAAAAAHRLSPAAQEARRRP